MRYLILEIDGGLRNGDPRYTNTTSLGMKSGWEGFVLGFRQAPGMTK